MQQKIQKFFFDFEIIAFELLALNICFYREIILASGVNMLTNSLKISDITKMKLFGLIFFQIDHKKYDKNTVLQISAVFGTF